MTWADQQIYSFFLRNPNCRINVEVPSGVFRRCCPSLCRNSDKLASTGYWIEMQVFLLRTGCELLGLPSRSTSNLLGHHAKSHAGHDHVPFLLVPRDFMEQSRLICSLARSNHLCSINSLCKTSTFFQYIDMRVGRNVFLPTQRNKEYHIRCGRSMVHRGIYIDRRERDAGISTSRLDGCSRRQSRRECDDKHLAPPSLR
jgi:hypothetical protein